MSEKNKILSVAKPKKLKKVNVPSATEKKKVGELGDTSKNSIRKKKKQTKNLKNARGGSLKKSFPDSLRKESSSKRALLNLSDLYQEKKNKATINKKKRGTAPDTIEEQTNVLTKVVFKKRKRVGRGRATGYGKTSGRGHKGQKARSGYSAKRGFEGGQMPLYRRLPKRGFTALSPTKYQIVNIGDLMVKLKGETKITMNSLVVSGLIKNQKGKVKILGNLPSQQKKINISYQLIADAYSRRAQKVIEESGGICELRQKEKKAKKITTKKEKSLG